MLLHGRAGRAAREPVRIDESKGPSCLEGGAASNWPVWAMLSRYRGKRLAKAWLLRSRRTGGSDRGHPSLERTGPWTHARGSPTPRSPAPRRRCSRLGSGSSTARASSGRRWRGAPAPVAQRDAEVVGTVPHEAVGVDEDESRLGAQPRGCDAERVGRGSVTVKLDGTRGIKASARRAANVRACATTRGEQGCSSSSHSPRAS